MWFLHTVALKTTFLDLAIQNKTVAINWSGNYAELVEFSRVESIYYIVGKSLLKTRARITNIDDFGNHYYKLGQLGVITKFRKSQYKERKVIYFKVEQVSHNGRDLLQSGATITKYRCTKLKNEADKTVAGVWYLFLIIARQVQLFSLQKA